MELSAFGTPSSFEYSRGGMRPSQHSQMVPDEGKKREIYSSQKLKLEHF